MSASQPAPAGADRRTLPARPSPAKQVLRAMITIAVFALLGPVIGGLVTILGFVAFGFNMVSFSDAGLAILSMTAYGLWLAYPVGILPAAVVGVIVSVRDVYGEGTRLVEAAVLGLVTGVIWGFVVGGRSDNRLFAYLVVVGSFLATVACWWLTRRRKRRAAAGPAGTQP